MSAETGGMRRRVATGRAAVVLAFVLAQVIGFMQAPTARAQETASGWQSEAQRFAEARQWGRAIKVVDEEISRAPQDLDARAYRAELLLWSGKTAEAESEFRWLTSAEPRDADLLLGLASAIERDGRWEEALQMLDRSVELDPQRADLRVARGEALRALTRPDEAREEFRAALALDPQSATAAAGLRSLRAETKHELRFGTDTYLFSYTRTNNSQWTSLASRWTPRWSMAIAGNFYQWGGAQAAKFVASLTAHSHHWGALTAGGAAAHDSGFIPKGEAFFEYDRGWRISETGFVRGVEMTYGQHWYWYTAAQIFTLGGSAVVYLPRDWSWALGALGAHSQFPGTPAGWQPSGATKLSFPLAGLGHRRLDGNLFFAVGTENYALVNNVGSFSSQTLGGGLRFRITTRQDVTAYAAYQKRSQGFTQTSFGFSYGIRF